MFGVFKVWPLKKRSSTARRHSISVSSPGDIANLISNHIDFHSDAAEDELHSNKYEDDEESGVESVKVCSLD